MPDLLSAIVLGIVQGVTEWLPVSSSGHLVIFQELFGFSGELVFDIMLHLATLLVVLFVFRKEILMILKSLIRLDFKSGYGRLFLFIIIGSIPTALMGYFLEGFFSSLFHNLAAVGLALIITGFILLLTRFRVTETRLNNKKSLLVGLFQGFSIAPGISRSGATVGSCLIMGVPREDAVRFSFLLSIPAILGATLYKLGDAIMLIENPLPLVAGMLVSILVGYVSLKFVINTILRKRFYLFFLYCWIIGFMLILLQILI